MAYVGDVHLDIAPAHHELTEFVVVNTEAVDDSMLIGGRWVSHRVTTFIEGVFVIVFSDISKQFETVQCATAICLANGLGYAALYLGVDDSCPNLLYLPHAVLSRDDCQEGVVKDFCRQSFSHEDMLPDLKMLGAPATSDRLACVLQPMSLQDNPTSQFFCGQYATELHVEY